MKLILKFLLPILGVLMLANVANAEPSREQLQQMVVQLQKSPNDNALREQIIKLAQELKPALAVPEEAERHMAYGIAAAEGAKSVADYGEVVKEFELATLAAPWWGDAYFNLGLVQDKAENYEAALRNLKLAQLATPDSKDIKALIYQVEYRNKKALATSKPGESFRDCSDCPEMVVIPAGSFSMGSPSNEAGRNSNESPQHRVEVKSFAMGKTEVTYGQLRAVVGSDPRLDSFGDNYPLQVVTWDSAQEYILKLNQKTGKNYRLPSEAEWEYACRAGVTHTYCGSDNLDTVAWYAGNSGYKTHAVATRQPNAFGLYESPRVFRRLISLSHATSADSSIWR